MKYEQFSTPCEGMKHPSADSNSSPALFVTAQIIKTSRKLRHTSCGVFVWAILQQSQGSTLASNGEMGSIWKEAVVV
jgi:hypothetical protein